MSSDCLELKYLVGNVQMYKHTFNSVYYDLILCTMKLTVNTLKLPFLQGRYVEI